MKGAGLFIMIQTFTVFIEALRVEQPWWLLLLVLLPLLWMVAGTFLEIPGIRFPGVLKLRQEGFSMHPFFPGLRGAFWWCGVMLLVIALARPTMLQRVSPGEEKGIDIMLALDVSRSMLQEDFDGKSRLAAAKQVALQCIDRRKRDRMGLVVFRGKSFTRCPLTLDHDVLSTLVREASVDAVPESGTAIGSAILIAVSRLRASESPERVLILITDGEHNAGEVGPATAAEIAAAESVRIYQINVLVPGSSDGEGHVAERQAADLRDAAAGVARMTGGRSFDASDEAALNRVFNEIDRLEKSRFADDAVQRQRPLYPYLLAIALSCFLLELALSATRFVRVP